MRLILTAVLLTLAAPALAQTAPQEPAAAATLPDAFGPAVAPVQRPLPPAPSAALAPADPQAGEAVVREVVAEAQAGALTYDRFTPDLATRVRAQAPQLVPILQGFGALQTVEYGGEQNGASMYLAVFENAATQWIVGRNAEGKVALLLFRPAPAESSDE